MSVSADEMEEFASKLHDRAGADGLFTGSDSSQLVQTPPAAAKPDPHALSEKFSIGGTPLTQKNMYQSKKQPVGGVGDSLFVAENTKAWAKLPKDFSPSTLGGLSVNPAPPDFRHMASSDYSQLFHEAADSASKEYDRPYDVLVKESEEKKKRYEQRHEGEADDLPDMKDVLVQMYANIRSSIHSLQGMRATDENELVVEADDEPSDKKKGKKEKKPKVSNEEAMAYTNALAE